MLLSRTSETTARLRSCPAGRRAKSTSESTKMYNSKTLTRMKINRVSLCLASEISFLGNIQCKIHHSTIASNDRVHTSQRTEILARLLRSTRTKTKNWKRTDSVRDRLRNFGGSDVFVVLINLCFCARSTKMPRLPMIAPLPVCLQNILIFCSHSMCSLDWLAFVEQTPHPPCVVGLCAASLRRPIPAIIVSLQFAGKRLTGKCSRVIVRPPHSFSRRMLFLCQFGFWVVHSFDIVATKAVVSNCSLRMSFHLFIIEMSS